jgi:hypothetical protein
MTCFEIKGFAIHIKETDEGIVVDIFDREALKNSNPQPIASTWALDHEVGEEQ